MAQKFLDTKMIYEGNQIKPKVQRKTQHQDEYTIPPDFFDILKSLVFPEILYCSRGKNFQQFSLKSFMSLPTTPMKLQQNGLQSK